MDRAAANRHNPKLRAATGSGEMPFGRLHAIVRFDDCVADPAAILTCAEFLHRVPPPLVGRQAGVRGSGRVARLTVRCQWINTGRAVEIVSVANVPTS